MIISSWSLSLSSPWIFGTWPTWASVNFEIRRQPHRDVKFWSDDASYYRVTGRLTHLTSRSWRGMAHGCSFAMCSWRHLRLSKFWKRRWAWKWLILRILAPLRFRRWFTKITSPIRVPEVCFDFVVSANLTSSGSKAECCSGHWLVTDCKRPTFCICLQ